MLLRRIRPSTYAILERRRAQSVTLPLYNGSGNAYWYVTTEKMIAASEKIVKTLYEEGTEYDPYTEPQPVVTLEEAFFTSYVEGAQITMQAAMDFLSSGQPPRDIEEQMITNNRMAGRYAAENLHRRIDVEFLRGLAYILTDGMDDGGSEYRTSNDADYATPDDEYFSFPSAASIPNSMEILCSFLASPLYHPLIKAGVAQGQMLLLQPFSEGNERIGRILSSMILLRAGYTFFSDVSLSALIARRSYAYYEATANILREENGGDLTYFLEFFLELLSRAVDERVLRQQRIEEQDMQAEADMAYTALTAPTETLSVSDSEDPDPEPQQPPEEPDLPPAAIEAPDAEESDPLAGFFMCPAVEPEAGGNGTEDQAVEHDRDRIREMLHACADSYGEHIKTCAALFLDFLDKGKYTFTQTDIATGCNLQPKQAANTILQFRLKGIVKSCRTWERKHMVYGFNMTIPSAVPQDEDPNMSEEEKEQDPLEGFFTVPVEGPDTLTGDEISLVRVREMLMELSIGSADKMKRCSKLFLRFMANGKYLARCRCGKEYAVQPHYLLSSDPKCRECGHVVTSEKIRLAHVGDEINGWEILEEVGRNKQGAYLYRCRCTKCGELSLKTQGSMSAAKGNGCIHCKPNYHFQIQAGIARGILPDGTPFMIDADFIPTFEQFYWCVNCKGYIRRSNKNMPKLLLHWLVMGYDHAYTNPIDHINRDKTDCRRCNLRFVTDQQNSMNRSIRSSLREFGFINPIIVDDNNNVLCGHGRLLAAMEEGLQRVPCLKESHLTEAQKKAYILADNRIAEDSGWDEDLLRVEIEELQGMDFDVSFTGFDEKEIGKLLSSNETAEDDFDVDAELEKPPITREGDVWLLGRHRLICGDSTKPETYDILMDGKKANLIVTDPPYNVNYEGTAGKIKNDNMSDDAFYHFLFDAFTQMHRVLADDGSIYVFHADTEGLNFRRAFADAGFYLSGCCVWCKPSLVLGRSPYQWQHEPVLYGWKKKGKHNWYADRKQTTVWNFDKSKKNSVHPTMKPLDLLAYPIGNSSMTNSIVLDPFGGSGSTLVTCEQTDRVCFTAEMDVKYADVIVQRFYQYSTEYRKDASAKDQIFLLRDGQRLCFDEVYPLLQ